MNFIIVFFIATLVLVISYLIFRREYTAQEIMIQFAAQAALIGIIFGIVYSANGPGKTAYQILNGEVTNKAREEVPCRHSYSCNCRTKCTGSGKDRHCWTECDTCYVHDTHSTRRGTDIVWAVYSNLGTRIEIDTLDSKGLQEPPRWTAVRIGESYAASSSYYNLLKGNSDSLFVKRGFVERYKDFLPGYPGGIYDYYRINRIVSEVNVPNQAAWERRLSEINAKLGPAKQCNVILVFLNNRPEEYFYALKEHWEGANKNDIVVVASVKDGVIAWAEIMSLTSSAMIGVKLRDELVGVNITTIKPEEFMSIVASNVSQFYKRKSMKEFEYLKLNNVMTGGQMAWVCIISLLISIGLSVFFVRNGENQHYTEEQSLKEIFSNLMVRFKEFFSNLTGRRR